VDKTIDDTIFFQFPVRRIKEIEALPFVTHVEEDRIVSVLPTFATYIASIKEGSSERDTMKRLDVVDAAITSAGGTVKSIKYLEKKIIFEFQTGRVKEIEARRSAVRLSVARRSAVRLSVVRPRHRGVHADTTQCSGANLVR